jgi:HSP20 family molecular chaperone IbpA
LPVEVDQQAALAKLDHGVLTLTLPKRGARNAAQITVN